jgi:hypothetical protein
MRTRLPREGLVDILVTVLGMLLLSHGDLVCVLDFWNGTY